MIKNISDTYILNNNVKMPGLGFGTWQSAAGDITVNAVKQAIKAGYRLIDTATAYGNEEAVGRAISRCGVPREELFIIPVCFILEALSISYISSVASAGVLVR